VQWVVVDGGEKDTIEDYVHRFENTPQIPKGAFGSPRIFPQPDTLGCPIRFSSTRIARQNRDFESSFYGMGIIRPKIINKFLGISVGHSFKIPMSDL
jgi:hypothetical protein